MTSPIRVEPQAFYIADQSDPAAHCYVFAYRIQIHNTGEVGAKLLTRHWIITDANGKVHEVRGDGVVGEQPWMRPGGGFEYTSGAVIETELGTMRGSYQMVADDGTQFDAMIPTFVLTTPRTLH